MYAAVLSAVKIAKKKSSRSMMRRHLMIVPYLVVCKLTCFLRCTAMLVCQFVVMLPDAGSYRGRVAYSIGGSCMLFSLARVC